MLPLSNFLRHSTSGEEKSRGFARDGVPITIGITSPQKEILDSIHYAKSIQMALIPNDKRIGVMFKRSGKEK